MCNGLARPDMAWAYARHGPIGPNVPLGRAVPVLRAWLIAQAWPVEPLFMSCQLGKHDFFSRPGRLRGPCPCTKRRHCRIAKEGGARGELKATAWERRTWSPPLEAIVSRAAPVVRSHKRHGGGGRRSVVQRRGEWRRRGWWWWFGGRGPVVALGRGGGVPVRRCETATSEEVCPREE